MTDLYESNPGKLMKYDFEFCVDIGPYTPIVSLRKIHRFFSILKRLINMRSSHKIFSFANATHQSSGTIFLPLSTALGTPNIFVSLDVVAANVLALLE